MNSLEKTSEPTDKSPYNSEVSVDFLYDAREDIRNHFAECPDDSWRGVAHIDSLSEMLKLAKKCIDEDLGEDQKASFEEWHDELGKKMETYYRRRNKFIEKNKSLVHWVIKHKITLSPFMKYKDAESAGYVGLCKAVDGFEKHGKFSSYAVPTIRGHILTEMKNYNPIANSPIVIKRIKEMNKAEEKFYAKHGRGPTQRELSLSINIPEFGIVRLKELSSEIQSLNEDVVLTDSESIFDDHPNEMLKEEWEEENEIEIPCNEIASEDIVRGRLLHDRIQKVMRTLSYREREIVKLRYGIEDGYEYTYDEIGHIFKATRERVRQIEAKAVMKLRQPSRSQELADFLD